MDTSPPPSLPHFKAQVLINAVSETVGLASHELHADRVAAPSSTPDSTEKWLVSSPKLERSVFVQISPAAFPDVVASAEKRAAAARERLLGVNPSLAYTIPLPIIESTFGNRTYSAHWTLWTISREGMMSFAQRRLVGPIAFDWIGEIASATISPPGTECSAIKDQLIFMLNPGLADPIRKAAGTALHRLEQGLWSPRTVLMHGDLNPGNVLLRPDVALDFLSYLTVIDWGASQLEGMPIFDLIRCAMTFGVTERRLARELAEHCSKLHCDLVDARGYLLAALGQIGLSPGEFSFERLAEVSVRANNVLTPALLRAQAE